MRLALLISVTAIFSFGCSAAVPEFDGQRAMNHLIAQCDFGPRPPGSAAHDSCRVFLVECLRALADTVIEQHFEHFDSLRNRQMTMTNIIARFGEGGKRRMLCAHWDTRPIAEHDPDSARQNEPILGANDGGSGVAIGEHRSQLGRVLHRPRSSRRRVRGRSFPTPRRWHRGLTGYAPHRDTDDRT